MKKLIACFTLVVLLLTFCVTALATNETEAAVVNIAESVPNFVITEKMIKLAEFEDRMSQQVSELERAEFISFDKRGDPIYKDGFAGVYFEKDGSIIYLTKDDSKFSEKFDENVVVKKVKYDYNELSAALNTVAALCMMEVIPNVAEFNIHVQSNSIEVYIVQMDNLKKHNASKILDDHDIATDKVDFKYISAYAKPTSSINAGGTMKNATRGTSSSACVGVKKTTGGELGMIMQGHEVLLATTNSGGDEIRNGSNDHIGYVTEKSPTQVGTFNANINGTITQLPYEVDASYVKLSSGNSVNNTVSSQQIVAGVTASNSSTSKTVYMLGAKTGSASWGTITDVAIYYRLTDTRPNPDRTFWCKGVRAQYASQLGDSGGLVYQLVNGKIHWAGVQSAQGGSPLNATHSIFADAATVATQFGVKVS